MNFWLNQLKTGMKQALKECEKNMENVMSEEIKEIDYLITLAKEDSEVKDVLLSRVLHEFDDLKEKQRTIFFEDMVSEICEIAKHDTAKKWYLLKQILEYFTGELEEHWYEYFASNGIIREIP